MASENLSRGDSLRVDLYFWLQALVVALVSLILVFTFIGRVIGVIGISMEPTLYDGDMVLLQTIGYTPKQNDVVVITHYAYGEDPIIKRVIATEGQTVSIDYDLNTVTVDGVVLDEPYINYAEADPMLERRVSTDHVTVPENHIFVLGDNRNHSSDSRAPEIGLIDTREILGRAHAVVFPLGDFGWIG